jgi:hypothetical protein
MLTVLSETTLGVLNIVGEYIAPTELIHVGSMCKEAHSLVTHTFAKAVSQGRLDAKLFKCLEAVRQAVVENEYEAKHIVVIEIGICRIISCLVNTIVLVQTDDNVAKMTMVPQRTFVFNNGRGFKHESIYDVDEFMTWMQINRHHLADKDQVPSPIVKKY